MPTTEQLYESMESQMEFPGTRREDDPLYVAPSKVESPSTELQQAQERIKELEEALGDAWDNLILGNTEEAAKKIQAALNPKP